MKTSIKATLSIVLAVLFLTAVPIAMLAGSAHAEKSTKALIENAVSAAPQVITQDATIKTMDGKVLREGAKWLELLP